MANGTVLASRPLMPKFHSAPQESRPKSPPKPQPGFSWDQIDSLRRTEAIEQGRPGPEWFTREEYARHYNVSLSAARGQLTRLVRAGVVETAMALYLGHKTRFWRTKETANAAKRES